MKKLHLGCGMRYLDGYINIDYPASEHTVQEALVADCYADLTQLVYPQGTVDEVRSHHVFEHFPRPVALALLCRWSDWLKPGALLRIETPDVMACARALAWPWVSAAEKKQVLRHMFGSHEAGWAVHWDGWSQGRFAETLSVLGYKNLRFVKTRAGALRNVEVFAERGMRSFSISEYREAVAGLLEQSLISYKTPKRGVQIAASERAMHGFWMRQWEEAYRCTGGEGD